MKNLSFFILSLIFSMQLNAQDGVEPLQKGPVHEAFIVKEVGSVIYQAVPMEPPAEIQEQTTKRPSEEYKWISGYWSWSQDQGDYIWISGVWRRSPPGHQWIKGHWQHFDEGWVWIHGFWSTNDISTLQYIDEAPKDPIDEKVVPAPSSDYFWVNGYWEYDFTDKEYEWIRGKWQPFDASWIYVPAHYIWRQEGYVFVDGFWDWPLDERGVAYASVQIDPSIRANVVFEPSVVLSSEYMIQHLFPCWPSYPCLYHTHYHFYPHLWIDWGVFVPWWGWDMWWTFAWGDQWALWWWWSHPGFVHPFWIDALLAGDLLPPSNFVLKMMKDVEPPANVTENGVVPDSVILDAIEDVLDSKKPILPSDPRQRKEIMDQITPPASGMPTLKPSAEKAPTTPPAKPNFEPEDSEHKRPPRRAIIPVAPKTPERKPPGLQRVPPTRVRPQRPQRPQVRPQRVPPTRYVPPSSRRPYQPTRPPARPHYEPSRPRPQPSYPSPSTRPRPRPYQPPTQSYPQYRPSRPAPSGPSEIPSTPQRAPTQQRYGSTPEVNYPQTPMQLQHQDRIMTNPQNQIHRPSEIDRY